LLITFPASRILSIGFSPEWGGTGARSEGALALSRRAPHGHDQIPGVLSKTPTCDTSAVASRILADLRLPQVEIKMKISNILMEFGRDPVARGG